MKHTFRYLVGAPLRPGAEIELSGDDSHHLARVVRRREGDPVELLDGDGRIWPAVVLRADAPALVEVGEPRSAPPPSGVTLAIAAIERGRMDAVVEKAGELGVPRILVFACDRVGRRPDPDSWRRHRARMRRVSEAAARQSGQGFLPRVDGMASFDEVLDEIPPGEGILLDAGGDRALADRLGDVPSGGRLTLIVGPEAGFAAAELDRAAGAGLVTCRMGPATLRSETAAIVGLGLCLQATGHLAIPRTREVEPA